MAPRGRRPAQATAWAAVFGLVCAHAKTRTRGFAWNLPIHFFGDIGVCVTLVALAN